VTRIGRQDQNGAPAHEARAAEASPPFPQRPMRGLRARYVKQAGCPSYFADVAFSAEPLGSAHPAVEVLADEAVAVLPHADLWEPAFLAAFRNGFAEALEEDHPELRPDVLLVVTEMRIHEVDSNEVAFRLAGRAGLRLLLARMAEEPDFD
jgi:hypothetical protein